MAVKKIKRRVKRSEVGKKGKEEERYEAIKEAKRFMGDRIPSWQKVHLQGLVGLDLLIDVQQKKKTPEERRKIEEKIDRIKTKGEESLSNVPREQRKEFEEAFIKVLRHPEVYKDLKEVLKEKYFS